MRHADAGYDIARDVARANRVWLPMQEPESAWPTRS